MQFTDYDAEAIAAKLKQTTTKDKQKESQAEPKIASK